SILRWINRDILLAVLRLKIRGARTARKPDKPVAARLGKASSDCVLGCKHRLVCESKERVNSVLDEDATLRGDEPRFLKRNRADTLQNPLSVFDESAPEVGQVLGEVRTSIVETHVLDSA